MTGFRTVQLSLLVTGVACSTEFAPQPCSVDGDCGDGLVCELRDSQPTCVRTEDAPLVIGQSAPASGTNQALGTSMKLGIELAFKERNDAGGIRGRQLQLVFRDDAYQPELAEAAVRSLIDVQVAAAEAPRCPSTSSPVAEGAPVSATALSRGPNAVLAILGSVGTPTMVRAAPVAIETGTVFFGAFTGASTLLRDSVAGPACGRYIFNVRASYAQEAQATIEYFRNKGVTRHRNLVSFDQADSFGQNGYDGLVAAYRNTYGAFPAGTDPVTPIFRVRYVRNDEASVPAQAVRTQGYLAQLLGEQASGQVAVGIFMTDTYGAAAEFIKAMRIWQYASDQQVPSPSLAARSRLKLLFSNVSFVGANSLAERLQREGKVPLAGEVFFTDDVVISQVVPNYQDDSSEVVSAYNDLIEQADEKPSFTSLEGYISARVFIAGLERHQGPFTAGSIVASLERLPDLGLGIGVTSGFSDKNHQYTNSVWGTVLTPQGGFRNLYFWSAESGVEFFE